MNTRLKKLTTQIEAQHDTINRMRDQLNAVFADNIHLRRLTRELIEQEKENKTKIKLKGESK